MIVAADPAAQTRPMCIVVSDKVRHARLQILHLSKSWATGTDKQFKLMHVDDQWITWLCPDYKY